MSIEKKLLGTSPSGDAQNVEDVFSTYLYEGTGSAITITNGIDLDGEGGMVWIKRRNYTRDHVLLDTERGSSKYLISNSTASEATDSGTLSQFNSDGFSVGTSAQVGQDEKPYVSWTFRKAPRFFDVVTYTGNGVAGREIAHDLGCDVGMMIVKNTSASHRWWVQHTSVAANAVLELNTTSAAYTGSGIFNSTRASDTSFTVSNYSADNASGSTYVAYIFAHDPLGENDDGMIACGSYTADTTNGVSVDLGWEPQYILIKSSSNAASWYIVDILRGAAVGSSQQSLSADSSASEAASTIAHPTSTGFSIPSGTNYQTNEGTRSYIYMAIRAPMMKEPEAGTEVFMPSSGLEPQSSPLFTAGFSDMTLHRGRLSDVGAPWITDRLRGNGVVLETSSASSDTTYSTYFKYDSNAGAYIPALGYYNNSGGGSIPYALYAFKRAKGFFDVVAYSGTSSAHAESHSLGAIPAFMLIKRRNNAAGWAVYHKDTGTSKYMLMDSYDPETETTNYTAAGDHWNGTTPTDTNFSLGGHYEVNYTGSTYVAYLFASLDGVSKVGSYTGNGSNQNIACGFSGGARFVLIKRTDSNSDWLFWDTERGIVTGNDPHLSLNTTAAQVTSNDSIDPVSTGFTVNQVSATNINVSSGTYIFLAIA